MTEADITSEIATLLGQGKTDEEIIGQLIADGATLDQLTANDDTAFSAKSELRFQRKWNALQGLITAQLPSITTDQLTALTNLVLSGQAFDARDFERAVKKARSLALAGDTAASVPAFVILVGTIFTLRPDLNQ